MNSFTALQPATPEWLTSPVATAFASLFLLGLFSTMVVLIMVEMKVEYGPRVHRACSQPPSPKKSEAHKVSSQPQSPKKSELYWFALLEQWWRTRDVKTKAPEVKASKEASPTPSRRRKHNRPKQRRSGCMQVSIFDDQDDFIDDDHPGCIEYFLFDQSEVKETSDFDLDPYVLDDEAWLQPSVKKCTEEDFVWETGHIKFHPISSQHINLVLCNQ